MACSANTHNLYMRAVGDTMQCIRMEPCNEPTTDACVSLFAANTTSTVGDTSAFHGTAQ